MKKKKDMFSWGMFFVFAPWILGAIVCLVVWFFWNLTIGGMVEVPLPDYGLVWGWMWRISLLPCWGFFAWCFMRVSPEEEEDGEEKNENKEKEKGEK